MTRTIIRWQAPRHVVTLADLIRVGLLPLGTLLTCTRNGGRRGLAVVVPGGLCVEGHGHYTDPSPAVRAATGAVSSNGWTDWKLPDGRPLDALRQQYEHGEH